MTNNFFTLSKQNSLFLKGIAILCILLHNFLHHLPPVTLQNEFLFNRNHIRHFLYTFNLDTAYNSVFSLFGFYGTFIFLFLSGYGLTKSYMKNKNSYLKFTLPRIAKIYVLFITSALLYASYYLWDVSYLDLLKVLSLTTNFSIETLFMLCGPWWFFSFIIQFYLVFIPLMKFIQKNIWNILYIFILYFLLASYFLYVYRQTEIFYANLFGHLPEFSLGIFIAVYEQKLPILCNKKFNYIVMLSSLALVLLGQFYSFFFLFTFVASVTLTLSFFQIVGYSSNRFLILTGAISPLLFGLHGFLLRKIFLILAYYSSMTYATELYCFIWMVLNYLVAYVLYKIFLMLKFRETLHQPL